LAALCVLSVQNGLHSVLAAFSDFRVGHAEQFRFEYFLDSMKPADFGEDQLDLEADETAALWEYRTSAMSLVNAIVNSPEAIEDRIALREEFARRGLNEVMTVCSSSQS
jgi:diaphanous 1